MAAPRGRGRGKGANALPMEEVRAAKARKREHAAAERAAADPLPHFMFPSDVLEEDSLSTTAGLRRIVSHLGKAAAALPRQANHALSEFGSYAFGKALTTTRAGAKEQCKTTEGFQSDRVVAEKFRRLVGLGWLGARFERTKLTDALAQAQRGGALKYEYRVDYQAYDGAELQIRMPKTKPTRSSAASSSSTVLGIYGKVCPDVKGAQKCELLQVQSDFGVLVSTRRPEDDGSSPPTYCCIIGKMPTQVGALESNHAPCIYNALEATLPVAPSDDAAAHKCRVNCADRHPSNHAAEMMIRKHRRASGWSNLSIDCETHMVQTVHEHAAEPVFPAIRGMLRIALSQRRAGEREQFRTALYDTIRPRMRIYRGQSTAEAELHRKVTLRSMVVGDSAHDKILAAFLAMLPRGDWQNHEEVEVYVDWEQEIGDEPALLDEIAQGIVQCLTYKPMHAYSLSRWNGAEESVCQQMLLQYFHGVGTPAYALYARRRGVVTGQRGAEVPPIGVEPVAVADGDPLVPIADVQGDAAAADFETARETEVAANQKNEASLKNHIAMGIEFLENRTGLPSVAAQQLLWRMVVAPLQSTLRKGLWINSVRWERRERSKAARAAKAGRVGMLRDFRILTCARGSLEGRLMMRLEAST